MRVAVVGLGMAGATLAALLADRGGDVTVLERAEDPSPVGAGIWLQSLGQQVLDRLDLLTPLRAVSREVNRVEMSTASGRVLMDLSYDALPGAVPALGVHRGSLFSLLHEAVLARGVPVALGVPVTGVRPAGGRLVIETQHGDLASYDLVVGCDGSRSAVRRSMNVAVRDRPYGYGALWAIVDDADQTSGDRLYQRMRGTREYLGVLPTGLGRASIFWSAPVRDLDRLIAGGVDRWRDAALPLAGRHAPLVDRVTALLPATYRDVVVRTPSRVVDGSGRAAAVLVGDAAHAMSPQLGAGTSLALADAWTLAHALGSHARLPDALAAYDRERRRHLRWYAWWTRLLMPAFQSSWTPLAWPRDALAPLLTGMPGVDRLLVGTLLGDRTSPWGRCRLP